MGTLCRTLLIAAIIAGQSLIGQAADYPLTVTLDAQVKSGATTITSKLTIRVQQLMVEQTRVRVADVLKYSGYSNFVNALRPLQSIGTIETENRKVDVRYVREQPDGAARRLVLVADRPLFFLNADPTKAKAGYELTVVELQLNADGGVTGRIAGAARVKPSPDGVVLDDFAEAPVQLSGRIAKTQ